MGRKKKPSTNEERCEMSDLLKDECDHCRRNQRTISDDDDRPKLEHIVVAEIETTCQVCGDDIIPGDHIGMIDEVRVPGKEDKVKRWAHYGCGR